MEELERLSEALGDLYQIENEIDQGGMATVYLAKDLKHDRPVAVKVLRPELAAGLGAERFVREIEISANLAHPHILPLFDSGEADGLLYYVMPYVEGESLQDRLGREGKIPAEEAIRLTDQIASALTYAHERGVVHRDIKPANILLAGDQAVVADFGIARALEAASTEGLTFTGLAVGTHAYMSPEQALGAEEVDARSDVYSLGCVVYEMVTGGGPFEGTDPQALVAKRKVGRGPSLRTTDPSIPVFFDRAVSRAMATDPGERFDTATAFAEALTTGTVVPRVQAPRRWGRLALVAVATAVVVLAGWWIIQPSGVPGIERLAVLPVTNLTQDPEQESLAGGMHEVLISELGQLGLSVKARATMVQYRDTDKGIGEIARELDVDGVIQASVFREGDSLEISTRLFDRQEREIWARTFDGVLPNIRALSRGFARAIAEQIQLTLRPEDEARLDEAPAVNPDVYQAYLNGMHILTSLYTSPAAATEAIPHFDRAVEQNPLNALAWAGLAGCYVTLGHNSLTADPDVWDRALSAAERAIRLDPMSAEGWAALADYETYWGRDWDKAEDAFRTANELNPSLAWNHYHYAWYLALFGRIEEAVAEHQRAVDLDPLTPFHTTWLPALYWFSRDFEQAYVQARELVDGPYANGRVSNLVLGVSAAQLGLFDEAIEAHERMVARFPSTSLFLGQTYALAGRAEDARRIARDLNSQPLTSRNAMGLAMINAALGDGEEALNWLEVEPGHFSLPWIVAYPEFDTLRDDPRLQALFRRMNLEFEPGRLMPFPFLASLSDTSGMSR